MQEAGQPLAYGKRGSQEGSATTTAFGGRLERIKRPDLWELLARQLFKCALTGRELTPATSSLDHIVPLSRSGDHAIHNLQVLHFDVNAAKGTMTQEEFIALCREVVQHVDSKQKSAP